MIFGKDEKGFYHQDEGDEEKYYFHSDLTWEQFNELTHEQKMDYSYAKSAGKYDDYDEPKISSLLEEMAKSRAYLKEALECLSLTTLTDYGYRDKIGRGHDEKILEARHFSNRFKQE